ncbi:hypothetical protein PFICI_09019 [Pestalotiopsis fici W106-1]|uniref:Uncharacterized protein n=1 Tax=Pestalotiopsis fici (strain W106-1 / CGMCC3.15140) TaxID=1229662 RepID=W3X1X3_PESFW|nr:uncharacterized protein PFICI_09019 [Pestalotiopsis fici W106-1]ETS79166.1 hypothetical protein PFICI_09019 [Pestalotiopsis fici W106-1]
MSSAKRGHKSSKSSEPRPMLDIFNDQLPTQDSAVYGRFLNYSKLDSVKDAQDRAGEKIKAFEDAMRCEKPEVSKHSDAHKS